MLSRSPRTQSLSCFHFSNFLSFSLFASRHLQHIANMLKTNKTLDTLFLLRNRFTTVGAESLQQALRVNRTLKVLDVRKNPFGSRGEAEIACDPSVVLYGAPAAAAGKRGGAGAAAAASPAAPLAAKPAAASESEDATKKECSVQ